MTSRAWIGLLVVVLTLALQLSGHATSYADPKSETIESANGKYTLITDPKTKNHKVYSSDNLKEPLWSFERRIWHDEFFLSNDGQRVLWVAWEDVQVDDGKEWRNRQADEAQQEEAVVVYSADGVIVKKTFADVSNPIKPEGPGPIGDFWRVWRGTEITQKDDVISIAVKGKNEDFTIDLSKIKKLQKVEQGDAEQKAQRNPMATFKCGVCGIEFKKCSSCDVPPEEHQRVNHIPIHKDCNGRGKVIYK